MIRIRSLHQRITLFLILPVAVLLLAMGAVAFGYARNVLLSQWTDATILRLQRAAHHVDMRLDAPMKWMRILQEAVKTPGEHSLQSAVIQQLRSAEGVSDVRLMPAESERSQTMEGVGAPGGGSPSGAA